MEDTKQQIHDLIEKLTKDELQYILAIIQDLVLEE